MPDYRRCRIPGGTYFFTVNLLERRRDLLVRHVEALRAAVRETRRRMPFHIDAWVVLPDHLHCVWTYGDCTAEPCQIRWAWPTFTVHSPSAKWRAISTLSSCH